MLRRIVSISINFINSPNKLGSEKKKKILVRRDERTGPKQEKNFFLFLIFDSLPR